MNKKEIKLQKKVMEKKKDGWAPNGKYGRTKIMGMREYYVDVRGALLTFKWIKEHNMQCKVGVTQKGWGFWKVGPLLLTLE